MTKVVIDTNTVISAALSPNGNCAKIMEYIADNDEVKLLYSAEIITEYERVLSYERLNIDDKIKTRTINLIKKVGVQTEPSISTIAMIDESDRVFYDTAKGNGAILVTGNTKH